MTRSRKKKHESYLEQMVRYETNHLPKTVKIYDITNEVIYKVHEHYQGGVFYNLQAEEKTCWRSIALYVKGELKTFDDTTPYSLKWEGDILKIYRRGEMPY